MLAIQLAARPTVICLDEPTRGLDYQMKHELAVIVRQLADDGACVVIATHDVEFTAQATDRCVVLADGDVVADGPTRVVCCASPASPLRSRRCSTPTTCSPSPRSRRHSPPRDCDDTAR